MFWSRKNGLYESVKGKSVLPGVKPFYPHHCFWLAVVITCYNSQYGELNWTSKNQITISRCHSKFMVHKSSAMIRKDYEKKKIIGTRVTRWSVNWLPIFTPTRSICVTKDAQVFTSYRMYLVTVGVKPTSVGISVETKGGHALSLTPHLSTVVGSKCFKQTSACED